MEHKVSSFHDLSEASRLGHWNVRNDVVVNLGHEPGESVCQDLEVSSKSKQSKLGLFVVNIKNVRSELHELFFVSRVEIQSEVGSELASISEESSNSGIHRHIDSDCSVYSGDGDWGEEVDLDGKSQKCSCDIVGLSVDSLCESVYHVVVDESNKLIS